MASHVIRSATRIQPTIATPIVRTPPRRGEAIASGRPRTSIPPRGPTNFLLRKSIKLPELPLFIEPPYDPVLIPPVLTFSLEQAHKHLIEADGRFERMFTELKCKPFEELKPIDPFQELVIFRLNQPPPWPVSTSVRDRFLRFFDRSLPEKITSGTIYTFPSPGRLASVDENTLRTMGLTRAKAESVLDIADRFADGRLSTQKLADASDEQVADMLSDIRGIGKLTAGRFAILSLHRPDILPIGDLEIQKRLLNWVISSHEPDRYPLRFNPKKPPKKSGGELKKPEESKVAEPGEDASVLPVPGESPANVSSTSSKQPNGVRLIPKAPVQLPEGMTLEMLKARPDGKEVRGGCHLLSSEMEALTTGWKPYRSLGVIYMWALMDGMK